MPCEFAIIPENDLNEDDAVAAVFADLGDAIDWGAKRFGARYKIRHFPVAAVERAEAHGAAVPV